MMAIPESEHFRPPPLPFHPVMSSLLAHDNLRPYLPRLYERMVSLSPGKTSFGGNSTHLSCASTNIPMCASNVDEIVLVSPLRDDN